MELFHILNRGTDKRNIVQNDADRLRFMQGLYLYNDKNLLNRNIRRYSEKRTFTNKREPLVYVHAFCLMDNHYHLLLSSIDYERDNISAFMRKLNMGYSKYFNEKYNRVGTLWQGKYKSIEITRDAQFQYIPYYIHLNPLDIKFKQWRKGALKNTKNALDFLIKYKWSSFPDYIGKNNYPSIMYSSLLNEILGTRENQEYVISTIVQDINFANESELLE